MKIKRFVFPALILATLFALVVPSIALAASGGGEGLLIAWGTGKGVIDGDDRITVTGNGNLFIRDQAGDAKIFIRGEGTRHELSNGWIHYRGFEGQAVVDGNEITVAISGVHLRMVARGSGRFALRGRDGYKTRGSGWSYDPDLINAIPSEIDVEQQ